MTTIFKSAAMSLLSKTLTTFLYKYLSDVDVEGIALPSVYDGSGWGVRLSNVKLREGVSLIKKMPGRTMGKRKRKRMVKKRRRRKGKTKYGDNSSSSSSDNNDNNNNDNNTFAIFVLSASRKLHTKAIKKEFRSKNVRFATRDELTLLTNGLLPGSVPPFGKPLINNSLNLYVDTSITEQDIIAFNCGSLTDSVIMSVSDYLKISYPTKVFLFSKE